MWNVWTNISNAYWQYAYRRRTYDVDYSGENVIIIPENIAPITANLVSNVNTKGVCGVIYTSGSTGTPKGTLK